MSPSPIRHTLLLASVLALAASPLHAQTDPAPAPVTPDSALARDSLDVGARSASAPGELPDAMLGRWRCAREVAEYEPPLVLEVRDDGRWADRSTSRAVLARWQWDGAVLRLLRAGGDTRHEIRLEADELVSEEGYRCRKV